MTPCLTLLGMCMCVQALQGVCAMNLSDNKCANLFFLHYFGSKETCVQVKAYMELWFVRNAFRIKPKGVCLLTSERKKNTLINKGYHLKLATIW